MAVRSVSKLFAYNEWAWQRVFPSLAALSVDDYFAERPFFWHSLHGLTVHCYAAEWIWLQRVRGTCPPRMPRPQEFTSFDDLRALWDPLRAEWQEFVDALTADALTAQIRYSNTREDELSLSLDDLLRHVMNHATEHRSQITPTLAQLGHPTEPLDYAYFVGSFHTYEERK